MNHFPVNVGSPFPHRRTTQVFINLRDNRASHDAEPFVPFGRVVEGMETADALCADYGESAGGGIRGGKQGPLFEGGNEYLRKNFPRLDFIKSATVVRRCAGTPGRAVANGAGD